MNQTPGMYRTRREAARKLSLAAALGIALLLFLVPFLALALRALLS